MSVEKGVVICCSNKDYEISSWNEQGEITRIEGILTIAFFISVCSHNDRKELYLIMNIPYLVNMPILDSVALKKELEVTKEKLKNLETQYEILYIEYEKEKERLAKLYEAYTKMENKLTETQQEFNTEKERLVKLWNAYKNFEKENFSLKEQLGKVNPGWIKERDMAWRINPNTNEIEKFIDLPIQFDEKRVSDLDFIENDPSRRKFHYWYKDDSYQVYHLPFSLYEFLCGRQSTTDIINKKQIEEKKSDNNERNISIKFTSPDSLLKYFKDTLGNDYYEYSRIDTITKFIFENIEKQFGRKEVGNYCKAKHNKKPSDATLHKHLNLLIKHNIINKPHHGVYEVNKLSFNHH